MTDLTGQHNGKRRIIEILSSSDSDDKELAIEMLKALTRDLPSYNKLFKPRHDWYDKDVLKMFRSNSAPIITKHWRISMYTFDYHVEDYRYTLSPDRYRRMWLSLQKQISKRSKSSANKNHKSERTRYINVFEPFIVEDVEQGCRIAAWLSILNIKHHETTNQSLA